MGFSRYKLIGVIATNMNTNTVNVRNIPPPRPSLVSTVLQKYGKEEKIILTKRKIYKKI